MKQFSSKHLLLYTSAWGLWLGAYLVLDDDFGAYSARRLMAVSLLLSFSVLVGGPIGLLLGGRNWIWPGAFATLAIVLLTLVYPALGAAR